jgi:VCBS repeat-containing protein
MLHGTRITSDESAFDFARPSQLSGDDGLVTVPDAHLLFNGDFQRHGSDLKIVGETGKSFLVPDYFKGEKNPTLLSPEGASLSGDIVEALAGPRAPNQYAQAGQQASDQPAIGRVEQVAGNATIVRNGVAITANQGDVVRKGDVVQTGGDGMIAVLFSDGSTFSLSANARMVLNDFVFQSGGSNNSALISLVQGTIGFVAGQVAKTGDMRVETPVATMGIRGTAVLVEISANDGQTKFSVLVEPDGTTGTYNLYNKTTGALIGTVNNSGVGWVVAPAGPLQIIAQQVQKTPGELQQELNYFQQIFNIFNQGQQNPFDPSQHTDVNPQSTKTTGTAQFLILEDNDSPGNNGNGKFVVVTVGGGAPGNNSNAGPTNPDFVNNPPTALPDGGNPANGVVPASNSVIEAGVNSGNTPFSGKTTATGDVLNNDSDPDPGDTIILTSVSVVSPVLHGTLQIDSGGAYTYTLDNDDPDTQALAQGETATDVFLYTITDAYGATATATLTIVITGTNDAPVILDGPVTAEFTEAEDETGGESAWSTEGSFGYKDVDISDNNHGVSVAVAATETVEGLNLSNTELLELFDASLTQTGVAGTTADITWEFSAADSLFDYLALGEDLVLTYTLTLTDDYGATAAQTVTITVTGTNDAPVILDEPVSVDFTESEGQTFALVDFGDSPESPEAFQPAYQTGGALAFKDVDVSDNNHTLAVAVQTGGDDEGLSLCEQELLELLTTTLNQTGATGTLGSIDWNFAAPDDAFEYLAEGEELTLTYTLTLTDDEGASTQQTVTVNITGTNDAPVVTAAEQAGELTEGSVLSDSGEISFADVDASDELTVSHNAGTDAAIAWSGGELSPAQEAALRAGFSLNEAAFGNDGTATWTYAVAEGAVDFLAKGETVTLTVSVTVTDGENAYDSRDVTITITGTNDAPSIAVEDGDSATASLAETDQGLTGSGSLTVTDVDVSNIVEVSAQSVTAAGDTNGISEQTLLGFLSVPTGPIVGGGSTSQPFNWTFNSGTEAFDYLGAGETLELTYTLRASDGTLHSDQTVTITIAGTNDAPTIIGDLSATVSDDGIYVLQTSDLDFNDSDDVAEDVEFTHSGPPNGYFFIGQDPTPVMKFTGQQVKDGLVSFKHNGDGTSGSFIVYVEDGDEDGSQAATATFTINVEPAEEPSGTVTVTVETDDGYNTDQLYDQLLNSDVLEISETSISLRYNGHPETTYDDLYFEITTENLSWTPADWEFGDQGDIKLAGGTITEIKIFSDEGHELPVATFEGFNIDAFALQKAIDYYDDNEQDTSQIDAIFGAYSYEMTGGNGEDVLTGGDQDDIIEGGAGFDILTGDGGADAIDGGEGLDIINGGTGNDTLTGGSDLDVFIFSPGDGHDTITDFNTEAASPNQDWVTFSGFDNLSLEGLTFEELEGDVTGTIVRISDDQSITFIGVDSQTLQQAAHSTFFFPNT